MLEAEEKIDYLYFETLRGVRNLQWRAWASTKLKNKKLKITSPKLDYYYYYYDY